MRRIILVLVLAFTSGCACFGPNMQSEWVTSEGGVQRSTVTDETINPQASDCACNNDYGWHSGWHHHHHH
jgi:hypothetical protein